MQLLDLPPEIQSVIFRHVSREDRLQLVLVNRYVHDLTLSLLYETVLLPTRRSVIDFEQALFRRPYLSGHVRHILISDRNRDEFHVALPDFIVVWPKTHAARVERRQKIREWLMDRDKELTRFRSALRHILALVSCKLHSLTLLHYEHSIRSLRDIFIYNFPLLEELTIRGDYPPLPNTLCLPKLRRLHLAAGDMPNPWASFASVTSGCPNLTHIRITEPLSCILSGGVLAQALEVSFGLSPYDPEALAMPFERNKDGMATFPPAPALPLTLKELRLQPYPPEVSALGMPYPDHSGMLERLQALEAYEKRFKLLSSNSENYVLPYSFDAAIRDWKDRMLGGLGCWA